MLELHQAAITATLLHGPGHLPAGLFVGSGATVLRGLRVHANTISHARLVALEESFPQTRALLGEAEFNRLSGEFVESAGARRRSPTDIGAGFPGWLGDVVAGDLARVEWAWLESYNAADVRPLLLADLRVLDERRLLDLPVRLHPATRALQLRRAAAPLIDPAFQPGVEWLLITRPEAEVRLSAIEEGDAATLDLAQEACLLGNLIAHLAETHSGGGAAIAALIGAGAFEKV